MGSYARYTQVFCSKNKVAPQYLWRKNLEAFLNVVKLSPKKYRAIFVGHPIKHNLEMFVLLYDKNIPIRKIKIKTKDMDN